MHTCDIHHLFEGTHPVTGYDFPTVVHQGGGIQLLSCLVEANAIPDIYRRHHAFFTSVPTEKQMYFWAVIPHMLLYEIVFNINTATDTN